MSGPTVPAMAENDPCHAAIDPGAYRLGSVSSSTAPGASRVRVERARPCCLVGPCQGSLAAAQPTVRSGRTSVPDLPWTISYAASRAPMAASPPVRSTNRAAASALGPMEPSG